MNAIAGVVRRMNVRLAIFGFRAHNDFVHGYPFGAISR
jgi:hypothetical protein